MVESEKKTQRKEVSPISNRPLSDDEDKSLSPTKAKIEKKKEEIKASVGVKSTKQLKKDDAKKKKEEDDDVKEPDTKKKKVEKEKTVVKKIDESVEEMEVETDEEAGINKKKDKDDEEKKPEPENKIPRKSCSERVAELKTSVYQKLPSRPTIPKFTMP